MAAIPSYLKRKAKAFGTLPHELLDTPMIFSSTGTAPMDLTKMRCKHYLVLINRAGGLYGRILTEVASTDRTH